MAKYNLYASVALNDYLNDDEAGRAILHYLVRCRRKNMFQPQKLLPQVYQLLLLLSAQE